MKKPIILAILDGWGIDKDNKGNAVTQGAMPFTESLKNKYPSLEAHAAGEWVGLPDGQMGNSEVGHIHLGAGRIKYESLSLINKEIKDKTFDKNKTLLASIENAVKNNSKFHIMGLFSNGGVHSHIEHIFALYRLAVKAGLKDIYLHAFADGRDTKPELVKQFIKEFYVLKQELKVGEIATISGRYYAMDRDKRFERTENAFDNLVKHTGNKYEDLLTYVDKQYSDGKNDEFIEPAFNSTLKNSLIEENDSVVFANFRPDRAIQLASFLTNKDYTYSPKNFVKNIHFVSMMKYSETVKSNNIAFKAIEVVNGLGEWLSKKDVKQLRIAETEKIAHVTFFFDGGKDYFKNGTAKKSEVGIPNADCLLVPSPNVATYDLKPEMAAREITTALIGELEKNIYDVIILNYANCDMVGHTGDLEATKKAVKVMDECIEKLYKASKVNNATLIITADHGNAEVMLDENNEVNKKHTSNLVPIIITDSSLVLNEKDPAIADVAPTILEMLNVEKPKEMTRPSLILKK